MLDKAELREIASMNGGDSHYVSLYLNVDPLLNRGGDYDIHFKNMVRNAVESLDKDTYKKVKDDIEKIRDYVSANKRLFRKGLALISSMPNSFWKVYHLNVPVRNELIIDKTPYAEPLADVLDNYERYAVLLAEKEDARIFIIHLGEIVEYSEVHTGGVPGRYKGGGWFALSQPAFGRHEANAGKGRLGVTGFKQDRYERHIAEHVRLHLQDAVGGLESFMEREHIGRVIIGGSDEAAAAARALLPKTIQDKVIGTVKLAMFAETNEVLDVTLPVVEENERKQEEETVEVMITGALKGGKAVLGLADVISALQEQKVMKLVVLKNFRAGGYICSACGFLSVQQVEPCPACAGKMEYVEHMADLAEERAVQQGAIIEVIAENRRLAEYGGIGALLRF